MENLDVKEYCPQLHVPVNVIGSVMVPPSRPSPKTILSLSNLDQSPAFRTRFRALLVYNNGSQETPNPVKVIRDALSEALTYYYPFAGRVKKTQDGLKLQVECTGEGALFVEAATDNTLSQFGDFEDLKHSFDHLLSQLVQIEEVPALIFQVTRFNCGGLALGVSFIHSLCGGRGAAQFLNGVAEIARGEVNLSIEPVWQREILEPRQPPPVRSQPDELLERGLPVDLISSLTMKADDLVLASFVFSSDGLERIKEPIAEELKEDCTTFEVLSALAWRARIITLGIPENHAVSLIFAMNVRRVLKPPLAEGYYGNGLSTGYARSATAREVVNGSLAHAVKMIKKAKSSVTDDSVRLVISTPQNQRISAEDTFISDWRRLGFNEVDFGWGEPAIAWPATVLESVLRPIIFVLPPRSKNGVLIIFCVPRPALKALETEMRTLM